MEFRSERFFCIFVAIDLSCPLFTFLWQVKTGDFLRQQTPIQKLIAFVLLVVFTISIAPKLYFHDVIAHHRDTVVCHHSENTSSCVHSQPFHCHFDDLVVTAPFLTEAGQFSFLIAIKYLNKQPLFNPFYTSLSFSPKAGRGPPVA